MGLLKFWPQKPSEDEGKKAKVMRRKKLLVLQALF